MSKGDNSYPYPVILFDGFCYLCNSTVNFIIRHDKKKIFLFSTLQSEFSSKILKQFSIPQKEFDTVILLFESTVYLRSEAFFEITKILGFPWSVIKVFKIIPGKLRDSIYSLISDHRYRWFGKREKCMIPAESFKSRFM